MRHEQGYVQASGAMGQAILAGSAGDYLAADHASGDALERLRLLVVQRIPSLEDADVLLHLGHLAHPGQDDRDPRDGLKEPERPFRRLHAGAQPLQLRRPLLRKLREESAAKRLHDPYGDASAVEELDLLPCALELVVQIVELYHAELHVLPVPVEEPPHGLQAAVAGEPEMPDAAVPPLLHQVAERMVPVVVQVHLDVQLRDVVEEVEVEVVRPAFPQLLLEDLLDLAEIADVVARKLGGQEEGLAMMPAEGLPDDRLGASGVVSPCGVEIVDPRPECLVYQPCGLRLVYYGVVPAYHRKAHRPEPESGQPGVAVLVVVHMSRKASDDLSLAGAVAYQEAPRIGSRLVPEACPNRSHDACPTGSARKKERIHSADRSARLLRGCPVPWKETTARSPSFARQGRWELTRSSHEEGLSASSALTNLYEPLGMSGQKKT